MATVSGGTATLTIPRAKLPSTVRASYLGNAGTTSGLQVNTGFTPAQMVTGLVSYVAPAEAVWTATGYVKIATTTTLTVGLEATSGGSAAWLLTATVNDAAGNPVQSGFVTFTSGITADAGENIIETRPASRSVTACGLP